MSIEESYGPASSEQQSLVGPPAAQDGQASAVGLAEHTPEQEEIRKALLEQKELGLYTEAELLGDGRKILINKANANLAQDAHTGADLVRHASGNWLKPGDAEYDKTLAETVASTEKKGNSLEASTVHADHQLHEKLAQKLNTMATINGGSSEPDLNIDRAVLARIPTSSTMELSKIVGKLSALEGFPLAGQVEDVDPNKIERIKADAVGTSKGERTSYAIAQQAKKEADQAFTQHLHKQKQNQG